MNRLCIFGRVKLVRQVQSSSEIKHNPNFHEADNMSDLSMFWCFCIVVGCGLVHWCPGHSLDRGRGPLTNSSELRAWCPAPATAPEPSTSRFQATIFAPCHGAERSRGHLGRCTRVKTCYADQYCSLLLQDIDLNSGDITDKLIMLQVEPTQTPSSPSKMSRPWGSFTPGKFLP